MVWWRRRNRLLPLGSCGPAGLWALGSSFGLLGLGCCRWCLCGAVRSAVLGGGGKEGEWRKEPENGLGPGGSNWQLRRRRVMSQHTWD